MLGLELESVEVRKAGDIEGAFKTAANKRAGALLVLGDRVIFSQAQTITDFATKSRLPAVYPSRWFVGIFGHGGLMSYAPMGVDLSRRVAVHIDKILKGAKPADLPIEQPDRFELVLNLKAAKAIGLTVPKSILIQADIKIE